MQVLFFRFSNNLVLVRSIAPLEIHSLLYIFLENRDFSYSPSMESLLLKCHRTLQSQDFICNLSMAQVQRFVLWKGKSPEILFLDMIQSLSSYMTLVKLYNFLWVLLPQCYQERLRLCGPWCPFSVPPMLLCTALTHCL